MRRVYRHSLGINTHCEIETELKKEKEKKISFEMRTKVGTGIRAN